MEWTPLDDVPGHVAVAWEAVDEWLDEEELLVAHAHDPFTRIDVRRSSRHVVIEHEGELIADSRSAVLLFETGFPVRYYLPSEDVRDLEPSPTRTRCAYKGEAEHFSTTAWMSPGSAAIPSLTPRRSRTGSGSTPSAWISRSTASARSARGPSGADLSGSAELDDCEQVALAVLEVGRAAEPGDGRDAIYGLPLRQVVLLERDPAGPKLGNRGVDVLDRP